MTMRFVRPGHLHAADRVLSASTERGLTVAPPTPTSTNVGTIRLRTSGVPWAAVNTVVRLQTGGNPVGYAHPGSTAPNGSAATWRNSTDTTSQYRGYVDSSYLVRVEFPATYAAGTGYPSTPRQLADGALGFLTQATPTAGGNFWRVPANGGAASSVVMANAGAALSAVGRSDFVVLPSGRLVAFVHSSTGPKRLHSDDNGVTWSASVDVTLGTIGQASTICVEYVDDVIVAVVASPTGAAATEVLVSMDEGFTFSTVDSSKTLRDARTCVTSTGKILVLDASSGATGNGVREIAPGGGLGDEVLIGGPAHADAPAAIVTRDDGVTWAYIWNYTGTTNLDMHCRVSLDGGTTWATPNSGLDIADLGTTLADGGYQAISAGTWHGKIILLGVTKATTGSDDVLHMLTFGGWESVTESTGGDKTYEHTYVPMDYPDSVGWTRSNFGAGATITNTGPLRIVSTGADNTEYRSPTAVWSSSAGDSRRARFRVRINSGGSTADDRSRFRFVMDDTVNQQEVKIRFSTTGIAVVDGAGNSLGSATITMTGWVDFLLYFKHDAGAGGSGDASLYYKAAGTIHDTDEPWIVVFENATVAEVVGVEDRVVFGGNTGGATSWDIAYIGIGDDDALAIASNGFVNPTNLRGRPLTATSDYFLSAGTNLGARNAAGSPGDTYTVTTGYQYAKEDVWREFRPSRCVRSSADGTTWDWRADAGANNQFKGDTIALFGTNFRTCTFEANATDTWGAPTVTVSLDATLVTSTVGAANRGPGYFGPAVSLNWRAGQYRSDKDAHRFFVQVAGEVYEITDNDEDRLYVENVDFSAVTGTFYIFGDRMAAILTFAQQRFVRISLPSQGTSDDYFQLGTVIFDKSFTPAMPYDETFTDRVVPAVVAFESEPGHSSRVRKGPRRYSTQVEWAPIDYKASLTTDEERRIASFYAAIEGNLTPIVFWRDITDIATLSLVYVEGVYAAPNLLGELKTAVARIDKLDLVECV